MFVGSAIMLVYTSASLAGLAALTLPAVIVPVIVFGRMVRRLARASQDRIADTRAMPQRPSVRCKQCKVLRMKMKTAAFSQTLLKGRLIPPSYAFLARAGMTAIAIVLIFAGVTGILWLGAQYVLDGTMSGGTLGQFILYAVLCATSIGALSKCGARSIGSRCDRASGRDFAGRTGHSATGQSEILTAAPAGISPLTMSPFNIRRGLKFRP